MSGQTGNSVVVGIEVATYAAFLGVAGWMIRSHVSWQREIRRKLNKSGRQLRRIDTRGTFGSARRVEDIEKHLRELMGIRDTLVQIQQNTATMSVELVNLGGDVAEVARRVDRLEQHNRESPHRAPG